MKVLKHALILDRDERRYRGQYRIPVSRVGKFPKGSYFRVEMHGIDDGSRTLVILTPTDSGTGDGVHRVTLRGQLTFTPPRGLLKEESGRPQRGRYRTFHAEELPFDGGVTGKGV